MDEIAGWLASSFIPAVQFGADTVSTYAGDAVEGMGYSMLFGLLSVVVWLLGILIRRCANAHGWSWQTVAIALAVSAIIFQLILSPWLHFFLLARVKVSDSGDDVRIARDIHFKTDPLRPAMDETKARAKTSPWMLATNALFTTWTDAIMTVLTSGWTKVFIGLVAVAFAFALGRSTLGWIDDIVHLRQHKANIQAFDQAAAK